MKHEHTHDTNTVLGYLCHTAELAGLGMGTLTITGLSDAMADYADALNLYATDGVAGDLMTATAELVAKDTRRCFSKTGERFSPVFVPAVLDTAYSLAITNNY